MATEFKNVKKIVKNSLRGVVVDEFGTKHRCKVDLKSTLERLQRLEEKVRTDVRGIVLEKEIYDHKVIDITKSQVLRNNYVFKKNMENVEFWHKQEIRSRASLEHKCSS
jgi:hypothetical protein